MPVSFSWTVSASPAPAPVTPSAPGSTAGAAALRDFVLDPTTDDLLLVVTGTGGDLSMLAGADAVASDIKSRLLTFQGDWFLDTAMGLPFSDIFGAKFQKGKLEDIYRKEIRATPGVSSVQSLTASLSGRTLTIAFKVLTDFGALIEATLAGGV